MALAGLFLVMAVFSSVDGFGSPMPSCGLSLVYTQGQRVRCLSSWGSHPVRSLAHPVPSFQLLLHSDGTVLG